VAENRLLALEYQHVNEKVYELLLARILSQEFAPGQRLQVDDIAVALGVSRTPVKDAINRLCVEGLIVIRPRKGTFVADITPQGIGELFDVRLMMELHAAELAVPRATAQDLVEMRELVVSLGSFVEGDHYVDFEAFLELDNEFHLRIMRMADNALLLKLYRDINLHVQVARAYQSVPGAANEALQTHHEHQAMLAAFEARDVSAAREAVTTHVKNRANQFIQALEMSKTRGQEELP
jgi:DNA-binding GntR family transcriptional regulator